MSLPVTRHNKILLKLTRTRHEWNPSCHTRHHVTHQLVSVHLTSIMVRRGHCVFDVESNIPKAWSPTSTTINQVFGADIVWHHEQGLDSLGVSQRKHPRVRLALLKPNVSRGPGDVQVGAKHKAAISCSDEGQCWALIITGLVERCRIKAVTAASVQQSQSTNVAGLVGRSSQHLTHHGLQRGCLTQYQTLRHPN